MSNNNLARNTCLAEHLKTLLLAKQWSVDFILGDNSHKTLPLPVDLAHLLPRPPRCHPKQVVCQNSENAYSAKMLFVQTLRVFALWKCFLSKPWECLFCFLCENADCQNSRMFALRKGYLSKLWECLFSESWQVGKSIANYFRYTVGRVADRGVGLICAVASATFKEESFPHSPSPPPSTLLCNISLLSGWWNTYD